MNMYKGLCCLASRFGTACKSCFIGAVCHRPTVRNCLAHGSVGQTLDNVSHVSTVTSQPVIDVNSVRQPQHQRGMKTAVSLNTGLDANDVVAKLTHGNFEAVSLFIRNAFLSRQNARLAFPPFAISSVNCRSSLSIAKWVALIVLRTVCPRITNLGVTRFTTHLVQHTENS